MKATAFRRSAQAALSSIAWTRTMTTTQRFATEISIWEPAAPRAALTSAHARRQSERDFLFHLDSEQVNWPEAVDRALVQIDAVREQVRKHRRHCFGNHGAEIREARKQGTDRRADGVEGGHMINSISACCAAMPALGVRYMTLTHSGNDEWADSSTDKAVHKGLRSLAKERCARDESARCDGGHRLTSATRPFMMRWKSASAINRPHRRAARFAMLHAT